MKEEAERIAREIEKEQGNEEEKSGKKVLAYFLALVMSLLVVLMVIPYYAVKIDPSPKNIPKLKEVIPPWLEPVKNNHSQDSASTLPRLVDPSNPAVKYVADRIVTEACTNHRVCYAKALYYFVRDNFQYVSDPSAFEYVKSAEESLASGGGDCDDASVLLASLLEAVGIDTRFVFIPKHVYVEAYIPEARKKYQKGGMVSLDPTCKNCEFGEIPYSVSAQEKRYLG